MASTKVWIPTEKKAEIETLIEEAQKEANYYRDIAIGHSQELGMARLLDNLSSTAKDYLRLVDVYEGR